MRSLFKQICGTLELVLYALLPQSRRARLDRAELPPGEVMRCAPRQIRGGMDRFLDSRGELRVLFPGCLAIAAPALLFRLKREGFSSCSVKALPEGLYLQGRR